MSETSATACAPARVRVSDVGRLIALYGVADRGAAPGLAALTAAAVEIRARVCRAYYGKPVPSRMDLIVADGVIDTLSPEEIEIAAAQIDGHAPWVLPPTSDWGRLLVADQPPRDAVPITSDRIARHTLRWTLVLLLSSAARGGLEEVAALDDRTLAEVSNAVRQRADEDSPRWAFDDVARDPALRNRFLIHTVQDAVREAESWLDSLVGTAGAVGSAYASERRDEDIRVAREELARTRAEQRQLSSDVQDPEVRDEHLPFIDAVLLPELTAAPSLVELEALVTTLPGVSLLADPRANLLCPVIWRWLLDADRRGLIEPRERPPTPHTAWTGTLRAPATRSTRSPESLTYFPRRRRSSSAGRS